MTPLVEAVEPTRSAVVRGASGRRQKVVRSRTAMDVRARSVEWLSKPLVPLGAITVLAGQPGLGKSLLTVTLAADLSAGRLGVPGDVLMLTAEDPVAEVVVPRLKAARAKLTCVHFGEINEDGLSLPMQFPADIGSLTELVREHDPRLVVVDPLSAHFEGRIDSWKDQSVRQALAPLAALAEKRNLAVLVVAHLNKGQGNDPLQRLGGSIGLPAAARSVLLLGRDPDDPDGETGNRRVLAQVKSNYAAPAGSLAYRIDAFTVEEGEGIRTAVISETGTSPHKGSDLLRPPVEADTPTATAEAVAFLRQALADGPRLVRELEQEASQAGIPWDTVKRAKPQAGVTSGKQRGILNGPWAWELQEPRRSAEQPQA